MTGDKGKYGIKLRGRLNPVVDARLKSQVKVVMEAVRNLTEAQLEEYVKVSHHVINICSPFTQRKLYEPLLPYIYIYYSPHQSQLEHPKELQTPGTVYDLSLASTPLTSPASKQLIIQFGNYINHQAMYANLL